MAITALEFSFKTPRPRTIKAAWTHAGVVGSGDLEVLARRCKNDGQAVFKIKTKVKGFDEVWKAVLERFVKTEKLGNIEIEINDNAATPPVAIRRLQQALSNADGLQEAPDR